MAPMSTLNSPTVFCIHIYNLRSRRTVYSSSPNILLLFVRVIRDMRNKAEKLRRDKLNSHITKLGSLLPAVNTTPKRMDKTSILRLASNFLRCHRCKYPTHTYPYVISDVRPVSLVTSWASSSNDCDQKKIKRSFPLIVGEQPRLNHFR